MAVQNTNTNQVANIQHLGYIQDAGETVKEHELSANTINAYEADNATFADFCTGTCFDCDFPVNAATVIAYAQYLRSTTKKDGTPKYKLATIKRKVSSLGKMHVSKGFDNPSLDVQVKRVLTAYRKQDAKAGNKIKQAKAISKEQLIRAIERNDFTTLKGIRNAAVLVLGLLGAFRRSELAGIKFTDLEFTLEGLYIHLGVTKNYQTGETPPKFFPYASNTNICPIRTLKSYLQSAKIEDGFIFRASNRNGTLKDTRMNDKEVDRIVKRMLGSEYSAHSLRASFVTIALENGATLAEIMKQTGHKTISTVMLYDRKKSASKGNAINSII